VCRYLSVTCSAKTTLSDLYMKRIHYRTTHKQIRAETWKTHGDCVLRFFQNGIHFSTPFKFMWPCIVTNFFIIKLPVAPVFQFYSGMKLYMFRTVPLPIIRSLFTVNSALVYVIQVWRQLPSRTQFHPGLARKLSSNLYGIYQCRVYSK